MKQLLEEFQLYDLWKDFEVDFTYSFQNEKSVSYHKVLDHIFTLRRSLLIESLVLGFTGWESIPIMAGPGYA